MNWALAPANLPVVTQYATERGVRADDLIATVAQNGNWTGRAGDLVPCMIAATLGTTLVIHQGSVITELTPLVGGSHREVHIDLEGQHYSVHPSDTGHG